MIHGLTCSLTNHIRKERIMAHKNKDERKMWAMRLTDAELQKLKDLAEMDGVTMSGAFRMLLNRSHDRRVK